MKRRYPINAKLELSNIGEGRDPAEHPFDDDEDKRTLRDVNLIIFRHHPGDPFCFVLTQPKGRSTLVAKPSRLASGYVNQEVQRCFAVWHKLLENIEQNVAPVGTENTRPFCDRWNLSDRDKPWLQRCIGPLAVAGQDLFHLLFRELDDRDLEKIAGRLEELSRQRELHITIESDEFFIPWRMIYVHPDLNSELSPDGSNCDLRGFWGYRHIIEHNPREQDLNPRLCPGPHGMLCGSVNYDETIDSELRIDCIRPHLTNMNAMPRWASPALRKDKKEFIAAISDMEFHEHIMYFFCHGEGWGDPGQQHFAAAHVRLTDGDPICSSEILARRKEPFDPSPLVFINACQGGQVSQFFYEALVPAFLKRRALSVIGPQIDIPTLFAAEFAERFFRSLLHDDPPPHIAELVRDLTRDFLIEHHNPLGLVYGVYRGVDCYVGR